MAPIAWRPVPLLGLVWALLFWYSASLIGLALFGIRLVRHLLENSNHKRAFTSLALQGLCWACSTSTFFVGLLSLSGAWDERDVGSICQDYLGRLAVAGYHASYMSVFLFLAYRLKILLDVMSTFNMPYPPGVSFAWKIIKLIVAGGALAVFAPFIITANNFSIETNPTYTIIINVKTDSKWLVCSTLVTRTTSTVWFISCTILQLYLARTFNLVVASIIHHCSTHKNKNQSLMESAISEQKYGTALFFVKLFTIMYLLILSFVFGNHDRNELSHATYIASLFINVIGGLDILITLYILIQYNSKLWYKKSKRPHQIHPNHT